MKGQSPKKTPSQHREEEEVARTLVGVCTITGRKVQAKPLHRGGGPDTLMRVEPPLVLKLPEECYFLHTKGKGRKCTEEIWPTDVFNSCSSSQSPRSQEISHCAQSLHLCCHAKLMLRVRWVLP